MTYWETEERYDTPGERADEYHHMKERVAELERERDRLKEWMWLNHGHTGQYGDDGEMQCATCESEYGFFDWKRTTVMEIFDKIESANIRKLAALQEVGDD